MNAFRQRAITTLTLGILTSLVLAGCLSPGNEDSATPVVQMRDQAFTPATLSVKAGTIVSFRNVDSVAHAPDFSGATLNTPAGATSQRSFETAGDYAYACKIHGESMRGTIRVTS